MPETTSRVVLADIYSWMTPADGFQNRFQRHTATRGDTIDVSPEEVKRGEQIVITVGFRDFPALGSQKDLDALTNAEQAASAPTLAADALADMSVDEVRAYLDANPAARDHVVELERARGTDARKGVLALADTAKSE